MIICSPVQAYYGGEVRVLISEDYVDLLTVDLVMKAAGNYGGQFYPTQLAIEKGFQQIIWTDSCSHEYIEEAGTMNIFFRVGDINYSPTISYFRWNYKKEFTKTC